MNASLGTGLGPYDPDIKFLFGISSCQGIGTYVKPIPSVGRRSSAKDKTKAIFDSISIDNKFYPEKPITRAEAAVTTTSFAPIAG